MGYGPRVFCLARACGWEDDGEPLLDATVELGNEDKVDRMEARMEPEKMDHMGARNSSDMHTPSMRECSVVFTSPIMYAYEKDGEVAIELRRNGCIDFECALSLETIDGSAVAGWAYEYLSTEVVFKAGQRYQSVTVKLLENTWNTTVEFHVRLFNLQHCSVPKSFRKARVKVLDEGYFPSDDFAEAVNTGTLPSVSGFKLYWAYWWWNFETARRSWVIALTLLFGQLENLYTLAMVYVNMYMVNVVCNTHIDVEGKLLMPSREETAFIIAGLHFIPWLFFHVMHIILIRLDMKGDSQKLLQTSMFRRFMNLSHESQKGVSFEMLNWGLTVEAPLVADSFVSGLDVIEVCTEVGFDFTFVILTNPKAAPIIVLIPVLLLSWSFFRHLFFPPILIKAETNALSAHANEVFVKLDLVRNFFLRPVMNDGFAHQADTLQKRTVARAINNANTEFGLTWIPHFVTGIYIIFAVPRVLSDEVKLGTMLGMVVIIAKVGASSLKAHTTIMGIVSTFPALRNITSFLNSGTDVVRWKELTHRRAEMGKEHDGVDYKTMPRIACSGVGMMRKTRKLFWDVNLEVDQDQLIAIYGPKRCGKNEFLRVLSAQQFPTHGFALSPSSALSLLVPRESLFLSRSLTHNLLLGLTHVDDSDYDRIRCILPLCMLGHLVPIVDEEVSAIRASPAAEAAIARSTSTIFRGVDDWTGSLSFTDWKLLAIARALLMAPEILLLECPFQFFDAYQTETIRGLLVRHIEERGIFVNSQRDIAHPRTVFYTTEDATVANFANEIIEFSHPQRRSNSHTLVGDDDDTSEPWTVKFLDRSKLSKSGE